MAATIGAEDTTLVSKQAGAQASSSGVNIGVVEQQGSEQRKVQPAQVVLIKTKVVSQDPVKPKGAPHLCASLLGAVVGRKEPRQHQRVIVGSGMRKVRRGGARQLSRAAQDVHIRHAALLRGGVALGRRRGRHPSPKRSAARGGSAGVRLTSAWPWSLPVPVLGHLVAREARRTAAAWPPTSDHNRMRIQLNTAARVSPGNTRSHNGHGERSQQSSRTLARTN
jgi:hypothetical protein